jgi:hypothetical protein
LTSLKWPTMFCVLVCSALEVIHSHTCRCCTFQLQLRVSLPFNCSVNYLQCGWQVPSCKMTHCVDTLLPILSGWRYMCICWHFWLHKFCELLGSVLWGHFVSTTYNNIGLDLGKVWVKIWGRWIANQDSCLNPFFIKIARGGAVGWGTVLQAGRSRVRFSLGSLGFFIYIILSVALRPFYKCHIYPLFCSFYCKMYPYTCFDPRIIVRVFFKSHYHFNCILQNMQLKW